MNLEKKDENLYLLSLDQNQLRVLLSCMGESFANIGKSEYALRIGKSLDEAYAIAMELRTLMDKEGIDL